MEEPASRKRSNLQLGLIELCLQTVSDFVRFVFEVALWRDYILKRKLDFRLLPSCGKGVGYIGIKEFTDESFREAILNLYYLPLSFLAMVLFHVNSIQVTEALSSLRGDLQSCNQALQGLVVDLRGNPGG